MFLKKILIACSIAAFTTSFATVSLSISPDAQVVGSFEAGSLVNYTPFITDSAGVVFIAHKEPNPSSEYAISYAQYNNSTNLFNPITLYTVSGLITTPAMSADFNTSGVGTVAYRASPTTVFGIHYDANTDVVVNIVTPIVGTNITQTKVKVLESSADATNVGRVLALDGTSSFHIATIDTTIDASYTNIAEVGTTLSFTSVHMDLNNNGRCLVAVADASDSVIQVQSFDAINVTLGAESIVVPGLNSIVGVVYNDENEGIVLFTTGSDAPFTLSYIQTNASDEISGPFVLDTNVASASGAPNIAAAFNRTIPNVLKNGSSSAVGDSPSDLTAHNFSQTSGFSPPSTLVFNVAANTLLQTAYNAQGISVVSFNDGTGDINLTAFNTAGSAATASSGQITPASTMLSLSETDKGGIFTSYNLAIDSVVFQAFSLNPSVESAVYENSLKYPGARFIRGL